jgi:broad specificity phosphatase PhoE
VSATLSAIIRALLCVFLALAFASPAAAQSVIIVRHAERADAGKPVTAGPADPDLSAEGQARARRLGAMLAQAGITAIFVTEFKRTQQTAAPFAKAASLTPAVIKSDDVSGLVAKVSAAAGTVLVVGHSNTLPDIVAKLGVAGPPLTIGDDDFGNLLIVSKGSPARLLRLRY